MNYFYDGGLALNQDGSADDTPLADDDVDDDLEYEDADLEEETTGGEGLE